MTKKEIAEDKAINLDLLHVALKPTEASLLLTCISEEMRREYAELSNSFRLEETRNCVIEIKHKLADRPNRIEALWKIAEKISQPLHSMENKWKAETAYLLEEKYIDNNGKLPDDTPASDEEMEQFIKIFGEGS